jgi:hypothetical protein
MERVWQYPLFEAFQRRRGHRFGLGCELKDAPFPYQSQKEPVPLSELETALLCAAAHGVNGLITGDVDVSLHFFMGWNGRTYPSPVAYQRLECLFINDDGVFLYRPRDASKVVEIETPEEHEKILTIFREDAVKIVEGRPDFHPKSLVRMNWWNANKSGQTFFMPVIEMTCEYINFVLMGLSDHRWRIIDDITGKPAGIGKWIDNGFLNGAKMSMSWLETYLAGMLSSVGHYMVQNISLACAAMGLGCFVWGGYVPIVFLGGTQLSEGLGFRFITGKDGMPTPIGKDGYIEALCPPYTKSMDEGVDAVLDMKFGPGGLFSTDYPGKRPWTDPDMGTRVSRFTEEGIACAKAYCNYVYDTYGRFPRSVDAMQMPVGATVHHLELDFYDKYYPEATVSKEQRDHMSVWHGAK